MRKNVLITGGVGGLGKVIVEWFLKQGYNIIIVDRIPEQEIPVHLKTDNIQYYKVDLSEIKLVKDFINTCIVKKDLNIDIIVANAAPRIFNSFDCFDIDDIEKISNASFLSSTMLINAVYKKMIAQKYGRIIVISSKSGLVGYSSGSLYCAFKSAWITFHDSISKELRNKENITINTICPDSFSDNNNIKYNSYRFITNKILKAIDDSVNKANSDIHFPAKFVEKLKMVIILFIKNLKILK